jgi:hypothetical protein
MIQDLLRPQHLLLFIGLVTMLAVPTAVIVTAFYAIRWFRRNTPPARER